MSFNKVILEGNLVKDVEFSQHKGKSIANFTLAVSRKFGADKEGVDFFFIEAWDKKAETAKKYLEKGSKCLVEGQLKNNIYTNKDGFKVTQTKVIVNDIVFLSYLGENESSNQTQERDSTDFTDVDEEFGFI